MSVPFFAVIMVSGIFCFSPGVSAQPTALWLEESPYTHQDNLFVPDETIAIHIEGPVGDIYDVLIIYDPFGTPSQKRQWDDRTVPGGGEIVLTYQIPMSASSNEVYEVQVWDEFQTTMYLTYYYWLVLFQADVEVERFEYVPGETVNFDYLCWYVQDHGLVSSGYIDWMVLDPFWTEVASDEITITSTQDAIGTLSFGLGLGAPLGVYDILLWLNDTDAGMPDHTVFAIDSFSVDALSVTVLLDSSIHAPGDAVRVDARTEIGSSAARGAEVDVIVRENGVVAPQYGANNLIVPKDGWITHVFDLDPSVPDSTDFEVEVIATLFMSTASDIVNFVVQSVFGGELEVTLATDKGQYLTGETATITAKTIVTGTTDEVNYIFSIVTWDWSPLLMAAQNTSVLQYQLPDDYRGLLRISVVAKNSEGFEDTDISIVNVEYGLLAVNADREEYEAGDDITVHFQLTSIVMTNPTFYYVVLGGFGLPVESGLAGTSNFTYHVPSAPADEYEFTVVAVDGGHVVEGQDSAILLQGYVLYVDFDKEAYMPGETMVMTYGIGTRGASTLPGFYVFDYGLPNFPPRRTQTFAANGTLTYDIPPEADDGLHLFVVMELNVYAFTYEVIRIGNVTAPPDQNVTYLQLQLDNMQANMTSLQNILWGIWDQLNASVGDPSDLEAVLWAVWDELNATTTQVSDLENQIAALEADVAGLEDDLAAVESPAADNTFAYVAILFGIAGIVMALFALLRKPPLASPTEHQPVRERPAAEPRELETY